MSREAEFEALMEQVEEAVRQYEIAADREVGRGRPRVVLIPGIMGSGLIDPSVPWYDPRPKAIWGTRLSLAWAAHEASWRPRLLSGNGLNRNGGVRAGGLLNLSPGPDPYSTFVARLRRHTDLMVFPYDWRLSNEINARNLGVAIKARWWPNEPAGSTLPGSRVIIIAHSMGGLIARAFIEGLRGYRYVQRLITVATPHQGAPDAFANYFGWTQKLPSALMNPRLQQELAQSYASALQLLPNYNFVIHRGAIEPFTTTYARRGMRHRLTGLPVNDVRRRFWSHLKPPGRLNAWLCSLGAYRVHYHSLASTGLKTVAGYHEDTRRLSYTRDGDGTVPLVSALLPGVSSAPGLPPRQCIGRRTFRGVEHMRVLENTAIQDQCLALIPVTVRTAELETTAIAHEIDRCAAALDRELSG